MQGKEAGANAREVASYYVYESVRSMAVAWDANVAALGAKSGNTSLFDISNGEAPSLQPDSA